MKQFAVVALLVSVTACAQGTEGDGVDAARIDAPDETDAADIDAAVDAPDVDAPDIDAAVDAAIDAAIDAPMIDAPPIDAPMFDAPIDAPMIDAPIDAPMIDAPIDGGPVGNGDTCATGIDITAAAMAPGGTTVTGNLTGFTNDIQPPAACTTYNNDGPDAIYVLSNVPAGRVISASVSAPTWDSAVEIVQPCTFTPTCLAGQDNGDPEAVSHTTTAAGTYYVIVDSWDPGSFGAYTLTVTVQ